MTKEERNEYMRNYRKQDLVKDAAIQHKSYEKRKDQKKEYDKQYRAKRKPVMAAQMKAYAEAHRVEIAQYKRDYQLTRRHNDPLYHLRCSVRGLIRNSVLRRGFKKNSKTEQILGCTLIEFKLYLEKQFLPWMNWNNYGKCNGQLEFGWDIDHIIPVSTATTEDEIIKLNHYTNLRPLDSHVNRHVINKLTV